MILLARQSVGGQDRHQNDNIGVILDLDNTGVNWPRNGAHHKLGGGAFGFKRSLAVIGPLTVPQIARMRPTSRQRMQRLAVRHTVAFAGTGRAN